jgi:hypothetical protein
MDRKIFCFAFYVKRDKKILDDANIRFFIILIIFIYINYILRKNVYFNNFIVNTLKLLLIDFLKINQFLCENFNTLNIV